MLEFVRCPSCSAHYGLRPQRVGPNIRRARCFRCDSVFGIENEVARLLAEVPASPASEDLHVPEAPAVQTPEPLSAVATASTVEMMKPELPPSLTLGDLEGADEEILEKTLVVDARTAAEPEPEPASPTAPFAGSPTDTGSFSSAKDAIAKLLGNVPEASGAPERRSARSNAQMDVEATLSALDSTLGGQTKDKELGTRPIAQPAEYRQPPAEAPQPMTATTKLTHEEVLAAMAAATAPPKPAAPSLPVTPIPVVPVPAAPPASPAPEGASDQSLFKVQLAKETAENVTLEHLTAWIEQGRVQDYHMVARQFSDHWIEAGKVPSLRLVFDRIKRQQTAPVVQQAQATLAPPPMDTGVVKKGLFGGIFNRG